MNLLNRLPRDDSQYYQIICILLAVKRQVPEAFLPPESYSVAEKELEKSYGDRFRLSIEEMSKMLLDSQTSYESYCQVLATELQGFHETGMQTDEIQSNNQKSTRS